MAHGKGLKLSNPKVLIGLSLFFLMVGGMVADPLAGFSVLVLATLLAAVAVLRGRKGVRYLALALLIVIIALAAAEFPEASRHLETYKSGKSMQER